MDYSRTSVYTQEGNQAGGVAAKLAEERNKQADEFQLKKQQLLEASSATQLKSVAEKFRSENMEETPVGLYGLKTREEFVEHQKHSAKRKALFALEADQEAVNNQVHAEKEKKKKEKKRNKLHKKAKNLLSFGDEDEGIEASVVKNPVVDTSFLPDKEREELDMKKSLEYKKEWIAEQEIIKKQVIQVEFSYWEGVAHERCVHVLKSSTIGAFLEKGREALSKEFRELRGTNAENLIFIKEDMMIPPYVTFYDLMKANASKFSFQVQNKQSHSAKVCPRTWYELNKNAFPAINWTLYDPNIK